MKFTFDEQLREFRVVQPFCNRRAGEFKALLEYFRGSLFALVGLRIAQAANQRCHFVRPGHAGPRTVNSARGKFGSAALHSRSIMQLSWSRRRAPQQASPIAA